MASYIMHAPAPSHLAYAVSSSQDMPVKRRRKFTHKVRTGCQTCRTRRIKCDEQKPSCHRCTLADRRCDWYLPATDKGISTGLAVSISGSDLERRSFAFFRAVTANQLTGDFESEFWSQLVLQGSHVSEALRHAVMAVGALHEGFTIRGAEQKKSLDLADGSIFALRQYTKALGATRQALDAGSLPPIITAMCCAIFCCFETLQSRIPAATAHLRSGLAILSGLAKDEVSSLGVRTMNDDILNLLLRLSFQLICSNHRTRSLEEQKMIRQLKSLSRQGAVHISSITEARITLYKCYINTMFHEEELESAEEDAHSSSKVEHDHLKCAHLVLFAGRREQATSRKKKAVAAFREWMEAFDIFLEKNVGILTEKDIRTSTLLRALHSTVVLELIPDDEAQRQEPALAAYSYKQTFSWIKTFLESESNVAEISSFSPDAVVVPTLFLIAANVTDAAIRQEAIEILESKPRIEGLWDSRKVLRTIREKEARERDQMGRGTYEQ